MTSIPVFWRAAYGYPRDCENKHEINKIFCCLVINFFLLLFSRRSAQLLSPQVWNEDGAENTAGGIPGNILAFIRDGWWSIFEPVNGYLITIPKFITNLSLTFTIYEYPIFSTVCHGYSLSL